MDTRFGIALRSRAAPRFRFTPILGPPSEWVNLRASWRAG